MKVLETDIAIIGGGMGGVAAALAAAASGYKVILSEETDWLGGQMTSQGTSAMDEHAHIETFGGTRSYYELRNRIRKKYREAYGVDAPNPGNGWVSKLCFEPNVGERVLREMLEPHLANNLTLLERHVPIKARVENSVVKEVVLKGPKGERVGLGASYFLDATELGDLLPLTNTAYVTGAEAKSDTGEAGAPDEARPDEVQSLTWCFAAEYCPGESHTIPKPEGYERFKTEQPYSLILDGGTPKEREFRMFGPGTKGEPPFWTYRRLFNAQLLKDPKRPNDIALINWPSNDYWFDHPIGKSRSAQRRLYAEAKRLSLGFLYWLQTECPRDDGGFGYPELKLRRDVMGTRSGLAKAPYIRESRRILAVERIIAEDVSATSDGAARAKACENSVGIGWYQLDLHACVGNPEGGMFEPTLPFQIPLGSLIPKDTKNLLAACKNIGTTHLSNGAYRLHPVEWVIGEAAGLLAAFCLQEKKRPKDIWMSEALTTDFQKRLLTNGIPLAWATDVPLDHPQFAKAQRFVLSGSIDKESERFASLELNLDVPLEGTVTALGEVLENEIS